MSTLSANCLALSTTNQKKYSESLHLGKPKETKQYFLVRDFEKKVHFLEEHLKSKFYLCYKKLNTETKEIEITKHSATIKGNNSYAYYQSVRLEEIKQYLKDNYLFQELKNGNIKTNVLFITLTTATPTIEDIEKSWETLPKETRLFIRKLKRMFGNDISYFFVFEAHFRGGCHAHLCLILPKAIDCSKYKYWNEKREREEFKYIVSDSIHKELKKYWQENLDIQGCYAEQGLENYITKEMSKQGKSVEQAIRNYNNGLKEKYLQYKNGCDKLTEQDKKDIKQIQTYYYSIVMGVRMLNTSRSIPKAEEVEENKLPTIEECENIERLVNNSNNSTKKKSKYIVLDILILRNDSKTWNPSIYTGHIEPGTEEYQYINSRFEERKQYLQENNLSYGEEIHRQLKEQFKKIE